MTEEQQKRREKVTDLPGCCSVLNKKQSTKMTPVFFVMLYVLAAIGTASGARVKAEDCNRGTVVIGEFHENPCPHNRDPFSRLEASPGVLISEPWTKAKVRAYLSSYCSVAMPEVRQCFADIIVECDPSYQHYLNELAANTSLICQPRSTEINPWLDFLLSRLTEEEVGDALACNRSSHSHQYEHAAFRRCIEQARASIGMDDPANMESIYNSPTEDLVPMFNTFFHNYTVCKVRSVRDAPERCSNWRMEALREMIDLRGVPVLGVQLHFSLAQIAALFEFPYEQRQSFFLFKLIK